MSVPQCDVFGYFSIESEIVVLIIPVDHYPKALQVGRSTPCAANLLASSAVQLAAAGTQQAGRGRVGIWAGRSGRGTAVTARQGCTRYALPGVAEARGTLISRTLRKGRGQRVGRDGRCLLITRRRQARPSSKGVTPIMRQSGIDACALRPVLPLGRRTPLEQVSWAPVFFPHNLRVKTHSCGSKFQHQNSKGSSKGRGWIQAAHRLPSLES